MDGLVRRHDDTTGRYHDIIEYSRELTENEIEHYSLDKIEDRTAAEIKKEMQQTYDCCVQCKNGFDENSYECKYQCTNMKDYKDLEAELNGLHIQGK